MKTPTDTFVYVSRAVGIVLSLYLFNCGVSLGGVAANAAELIPFRVGEAAPSRISFTGNGHLAWAASNRFP